MSGLGAAAENIDQRSVIPERAFPAALEAGEHRVAFHAIVGENLARVSEFVGSGNQLDVSALVSHLGDVSAFSLVPVAFFAGNFIGIRATIYDARHAFAEFFANFIEAREAALVLNGIVQQRGDHFVFAAAVLNHDGRDTEQMADVGLASALAALVEMQLRRNPSASTKRFVRSGCSIVDCLGVIHLFRRESRFRSCRGSATLELG
jgi:hypothetical protein